MAEISFNWLLADMKGKACRHDNVYTKTNKQTGRSFAVKLCNPADGSNPTQLQQKQRTKFSAMAVAVNEWIGTEKAKDGGEGSAAYNKALAAYKSQHKYGSLRGFIMAKYMTYDATSGKVTINVSAKTNTSSGGSSDSGSDPII